MKDAESEVPTRKKDRAEKPARSTPAPLNKIPEEGEEMYNVTPPLFPDFYWDDYFWITSAKLPSWEGFQIRNGPYGAVSSEGESDGLVHILFAPEGRDDSPITHNEANMVRWVIDNEKSIHDAAMAKLLEEYPKFREEVFDCYDDEDAEELAPPVATVADLKELCGIVSINIHQLVKSGVPFLGVEFGCTWEEEHGAGVLLHGFNALECGDASTAGLLWKAEEYAKEP